MRATLDAKKAVRGKAAPETLPYRIVIEFKHPVDVTKEDVREAAEEELSREGFSLKIPRFEIDEDMFYSTKGVDNLIEATMVKLWYYYETV